MNYRELREAQGDAGFLIAGPPIAITGLICWKFGIGWGFGIILFFVILFLWMTLLGWAIQKSK